MPRFAPIQREAVRTSFPFGSGKRVSPPFRLRWLFPNPFKSSSSCRVRACMN